MTHRITLIPGDGIGPEVVAAAQKVLLAAKVDVDWETHHAGTEVARLTGTKNGSRVAVPPGSRRGTEPLGTRLLHRSA